jgi:hypothetical protein
MEAENDPPAPMAIPTKDAILAASTLAIVLVNYSKVRTLYNGNAVSVTTLCTLVNALNTNGNGDFVVNFRWIAHALVMFWRELSAMGWERFRDRSSGCRAKGIGCFSDMADVNWRYTPAINNTNRIDSDDDGEIKFRILDVRNRLLLDHQYELPAVQGLRQMFPISTVEAEMEVMERAADF